MYPLLYSSPSFVLYSYPFMMGIAWGIAFVLAPLYFGNSEVEKKQLNWIFFSAFVGAWLGAKLLFLLTLSAGEVSQIAQNSSFWLGGGLVFYGGFLGAVLLVVLYSKFIGKIKLHKLFTLVPLIPIGHAVGRVGCVLAGCCYGTETHLIWGIHLHGLDRHPVQIYESLSLLAIFFLCHFLVYKKRKVMAAVITYICGYAIIRFILEFYRGDTIRGIYAFGLSTSQWVAVCFVVIGLFLYYLYEIKWSQNEKI